jgi:hypothetical protein
VSTPDFLDETHQRIAEFADEFLDDEDERAGFIDGLMERRGYVRESRWAPPPEKPGQGQRQGLLKQQGGQGGQRKPGSYFKKP